MANWKDLRRQQGYVFSEDKEEEKKSWFQSKPENDTPVWKQLREQQGYYFKTEPTDYWKEQPVRALGKNINAGFNMLPRGMVGIADATVGGLGIKPVNKVLDSYKDYYKKADEELAMLNQGHEFAGGVAQGIGQAIPTMALALMNPAAAAGNALTTAKGTQLVANAASLANPTTLNAARTVALQLKSNPTLYSSMVTSVGNQYLQGLNKGASREEAIKSAIIGGVPSGLIEVSGGIENLANIMANKTKGLVGVALQAAIEEGFEEIVQYPIENIGQKVAYDKAMPLFSMKEQAVINPKEMAFSGLIGGTVGGLMGGGAAGVNTALYKSYAKQLDTMYKNTINNLPEDSPILERVRLMQDDNVNIDDNTKVWVINSARQQQGTFESETDKLLQKDRQKETFFPNDNNARGQTVEQGQNIVKTQNIASQAVNPVLSAFNIQNINNAREVKRSIYEFYKNSIISDSNTSKPIINKSSGTNVEVSRATINQTFQADEKYSKNQDNEIKVAAMANVVDLIQNGEFNVIDNLENPSSKKTYANITGTVNVNGTPYEITMDVRRTDSGRKLFVHSLSTNYQQVSGKKSGVIYNGVDDKVRQQYPKVYDILDRIGNTTNTKFKFVDTIYDPTGQIPGFANGQYDPTTDSIEIALDTFNPFMVVAKHEITHMLQKESPKLYQEYKGYVLSTMKENGTYDVQYERMAELYKSRGLEVDKNAIEDELVADATELFLTDENAINSLVAENKTLGQKILDVLRKLIEKIEDILEVSRFTEGWLNTGQLREAERLWVNALSSVVEAEQKTTKKIDKKQHSLKDDDVITKTYGKENYIIWVGENNQIPFGDFDTEKEAREFYNKHKNRLSKYRHSSNIGTDIEYAETSKEVAELKKLLDNAEYIESQYAMYERKKSKPVSINKVIENIKNDRYRREDLESLAEQVSKGNWDNYEDLTDEELKSDLIEAIERYAEEMNPLERQYDKYGFSVRPPRNAKYSKDGEKPIVKKSLKGYNVSEIESTILTNHNEYKNNKEALKLAGEAIKDLQEVKFSISSTGREVDWDRAGIKTIADGISREFINKGYVELKGRKVNSLEELAVIGQIFRDPRFETFRIIYTKNNKIVAHEGISSRIPGLSSAFLNTPKRSEYSSEHDYQTARNDFIKTRYDDMKDRMKRLKADGYYLLHNHPSGNPEASTADVYLTKGFMDNVTGFKGHVIINSNKYGWLEMGKLGYSVHVEDMTQQQIELFLKPTIKHPLLNESINGADKAASIAKSLQLSEEKTTIVYTDVKGAIRGIEEIPNGMFNDRISIRGFLRNRGRHFGSGWAFLSTTSQDIFGKSANLVKEKYLMDSILLTGGDNYYSHRSDTGIVQDNDYAWAGIEENELKATRANEENEVFYTPQEVEIIKNPTNKQLEQLRADFKKEYPSLAKQGEPPTRRTFDVDGNVYYWKSTDGLHYNVEHYIDKKYNTQTEQNKYFDIKYNLKPRVENSDYKDIITVRDDGKISFKKDTELPKNIWSKIHTRFRRLGYMLHDVDDTKRYILKGNPLNLDQSKAVIDVLGLAEKTEQGIAVEKSKKYATKAARHFGTTNNFKLAGYLTINGSLLDFSEGQGYRVQDHREIQDILDFIPDGAPISQGMIEFMNQGNIRLQSYGIDISVKPNSKQRLVLRKFFDNLNGEAVVDFSREDGGNAGSVEYPEGTRNDRILRDIDKFFDTGELPQISDVQRFRYSLKDSQGRDLTQEQAEFFKDSKVRDKEGNLLVIYHGSKNNEPFSVFKKGSGAYGFLWATSLEHEANRYANRVDKGKVYKLYADIKNPKYFKAKRFSDSPENYAQNLKSEYDGAIIEYELPLYWKDYHYETTSPTSDWYRIPIGVNLSELYSKNDGVMRIIAVRNSNQFKETTNKQPSSDLDVRYQLRDNKSVKDIEKLQNTVTRLKEQFKLTKGVKLDEKAVRRLSKSLLKDYSSKYSSTELETKLYSVYMGMINGDMEYDEAQSIITEVARDIIENASVLSDAMYKQYSALRQTMRDTAISINDRYKGDFDAVGGWNDFRKRNFGRMNITSDGMSIDKLYQELSDSYPELFLEDVANPADQLMLISDVLDGLVPIYENPYNRELNEAVEYLALEIFDGMTSVPEAKPTFADRKKAEKQKAVEKEKDKSKARVEALKNKNVEDIAWLKHQNKEKLAEVLQKEKAKRDEAVVKVKKQYQDKAYKTWWRNKLNENDIKSHYQEMIKELRSRRDEKLEQQKTKYKERISGIYEDRKIRQAKDRIRIMAKKLGKMLRSPTQKQHIPKALDKTIAELLTMLDFTTDRQKETTQIKLRDLRAEFEKLAKVSDEEGLSTTADPYIVEALEMLHNKRIAEMNLQEIELLRDIVGYFENMVRTYNKAFLNGKWVDVVGKSEGIIKDLDTDAPMNESAYGGILYFKDMMNWGMLTPQMFFERMGNTFNSLYDDFRAALDKKINSTKIAQDYMSDLLKNSKDKISQWTGKKAEIKTVKLDSGKTIELTQSQLMSFYLLMKREQARGHIFGLGIKAAPIVAVDNKGIKYVKKQFEPVKITLDDATKMIAMLSKEQRRIADGIGKFMNTYSKQWVNEATLQNYGYELAKEENYFPIKVDRDFLKSDFDNTNLDPTFTSMGFLKATVKGAGNAIILEDVFDVFTEHADKAATYNAFVGITESTKKIVNYKTQDNSIKQAMNKKFGIQAFNYLKKFMVDLQGGIRTESGSPVITGLIRKAKRAVLGLNLRTIIQQPTAIVRASALIDIDYLIKGVAMKSDKAEMLEKSPIARWKSWGYFNLDTGRSMKDIILDSVPLLDKQYQGMQIADDITWTKIWNAVKLETEKNEPGLKVGSAEYFDAVNYRFNEIIDRTQVVDTVMHRSDSMRQSDSSWKILTAFMSEPTKSYNLLLNAVEKYNANKSAENKKVLLRTFSAWTATMLVNTLVISMLDMWRRKEDDKETLKDKWIDNILNDVTGYVPIVRDIYSLFEGYSVKRMEYNGIERIVRAINRSKKYIEEMAEDKKHSYPLRLITKNWIESVAYVFGVGVINVSKDLEALLRNYTRWIDDEGAINEIYEFMFKK